MINFSDLIDIVRGKLLQLSTDYRILYIITDSRKGFSSTNAIFMARVGPANDGHNYIGELYKAGVRNFIVEKEIDCSPYNQANFLKVESCLEALQKMAIHHRSQFNPEIIGITGSNGKTIVKEWLLQLMSVKYRIMATPHSYNSQLGVPLSIWQLNENHDLGIFEAGISRPGEMQKLEEIIKPTIGIFTTIGPAHAQGFSSLNEKIKEKLKLFINANVLIYCKDHQALDEEVSAITIKSFTWGKAVGADLRIISKKKRQHHTTIQFAFNGESLEADLPVVDAASIENLIHCIACMVFLGFSWEEICERITLIKSVPMRLELKRGINGCYLIDDSYNNDLAGLKIALEFLGQQRQRKNKTVVLSDIFQAGIEEEVLYASVNDLLLQHKITRLIGIGDHIISNKMCFSLPTTFFPSTTEFLNSLESLHFENEMILIKGARAFTFEKIVKRLQEKIHGTRLEINLGAITHNLNFFRSRLKRDTKLMVMVKAFAYGTGIFEIANLLQYHKIDYLGVAYTDEGVNLRNNGIEIPIMIMNPSPDGYEKLLQYQLEPEIYSLHELYSIRDYLRGRDLNIHLKLDTGMHRLGFLESELNKLVEILIDSPNLKVTSIFSHLAASDDVTHDDFTREQARSFKSFAENICSRLSISPLYHLLNSAGIIQYPEYQLDMVRLGIGLYGIEPSRFLQSQLMPISTLKTFVSQLREVPAGSTVGYGRKGEAKERKIVATIAIGYADGFSRFFSNGKGHVLINGKIAPVIGNVCMDMTMVDVSNIEVEEGDEVIIFGENPTINELARNIGTIPYEILTSVSERVKRIYLYD